MKTPGVVTILFTLSQIPKPSAALIINNAVKYASPKDEPKVLFLKDAFTYGEDEGDPDYIKEELLKGYNVTYQTISNSGLNLSETQGYDLVIVSNPGFPLSHKKTHDTLMSFPGGVILIGDDMAKGADFDNSALTGLRHLNNGSNVSCAAGNFPHDNLAGHKYRVAMKASFLPGISNEFLNYEYGNDIDHTEVKASSLEVLATAQAGVNTCDIGHIPTVVRRPK